jgi:hypothetical protein
MQFMSRQTGIVMNNQMDDFASPNIGKAPFFCIAKKLTYVIVFLQYDTRARSSLHV